MVLHSCNTLGLLMSPQTDGQGDSNPPPKLHSLGKINSRKKLHRVRLVNILRDSYCLQPIRM